MARPGAAQAPGSTAEASGNRPAPAFSNITRSITPAMSFLYRYLLILIACVALLMGIQIPSFVDQYEKRLDAHLQEVQADLKGYQDIANRDFGGSMEALIRRHKEST